MKRFASAACGAPAFCLAALTVLSAHGRDEPYGSISAHNPFDLRPASVVAAQSSQPPPEIILNGVTTIFGDKRALFKVLDASPSGQSRSCFLSEGQRDGDIELLAVDVRSGAITVRNRGVVQVVDICKTPALSVAANAVAGGVFAGAPTGGNDSGATSVAGVQASVAPGEAKPSAAGSVAGSGNGGSPANGSGSSDNSSGNSSGNAGSSNNGSAASTDPSQQYHWWMKEAQNIEQARQATAQRVMDGTWPPYPLTPLTPPGTPARLIGPSSAYFPFNPLASAD